MSLTDADKARIDQEINNAFLRFLRDIGPVHRVWRNALYAGFLAGYAFGHRKAVNQLEPLAAEVRRSLKEAATA